MKKAKAKVTSINPFYSSEPVFGSGVTCYIGTEYSELVKDVKKMKMVLPEGWDVEKLDADGAYITCAKKDDSCEYRVMWMRKIPRNLLEESTLLHECIHLCQAVLKSRGVSTGYPDSEPMAYLTQFYYKDILGHIRKKIK